MKTNVCMNQVLTNKVKTRMTHLLGSLDTYEAYKIIAKEFLGTHKIKDNTVLFGFWVPGIQDGFIGQYKESLRLAIYRGHNPGLLTDLGKSHEFNCDLIKLDIIDDYVIGVIDGIILGDESTLGDCTGWFLNMMVNKK